MPASPETSPAATDPAAHPASVVRGVRRVVYLALAGVFFALAVAGAVLPGLPTTPFLLLTSYLLGRCSPRLNAVLLRSRWFGPILRDWHERRGVRPAVKAWAIGVVTVAVAGTLLFAPLPPVGLASVALLASVGLVVVARLPTVVADEDEEEVRRPEPRPATPAAGGPAAGRSRR